MSMMNEGEEGGRKEKERKEERKEICPRCSICLFAKLVTSHTSRADCAHHNPPSDVKDKNTQEPYTHDQV